MASVRYTFTLDAVKDSDIVRWLESQPNASAAVREALRAYLNRPTHADMYAGLNGKLDRVLDALRGVQVVEAGNEGRAEGSTEPAAARRGLDAMKERFKRRG